MTRELKKLLFKDIFPLYVNKVERNGHRKQELIDMLYWLCGYDEEQIETYMDKNVDLETFFINCPKLNPNRKNVTGTICKVKVQNIEDETIQNIRIMDKLVDDIAKGKKKQIWKS